MRQLRQDRRLGGVTHLETVGICVLLEVGVTCSHPAEEDHKLWLRRWVGRSLLVRGLDWLGQEDVWCHLQQLHFPLGLGHPESFPKEKRVGELRKENEQRHCSSGPYQIGIDGKQWRPLIGRKLHWRARVFFFVLAG